MMAASCLPRACAASQACPRPVQRGGKYHQQRCFAARRPHGSTHTHDGHQHNCDQQHQHQHLHHQEQQPPQQQAVQSRNLQLRLFPPSRPAVAAAGDDLQQAAPAHSPHAIAGSSSSSRGLSTWCATNAVMLDLAARSGPVGAALLVSTLATVCAAAAPADAADGLAAAAHGSSSAASLMDVAEGEEFWGNVAKYGRYFVTVMLGTGYVMVQPLLAAFKRPVTAAVALAALVGSFLLVRFTLNAMLGLQEPFDYQPGSVVPYQ